MRNYAVSNFDENMLYLGLKLKNNWSCKVMYLGFIIVIIILLTNVFENLYKS